MRCLSISSAWQSVRQSVTHVPSTDDGAHAHSYTHGALHARRCVRSQRQHHPQNTDKRATSQRGSSGNLRLAARTKWWGKGGATPPGISTAGTRGQELARHSVPGARAVPNLSDLETAY